MEIILYICIYEYLIINKINATIMINERKLPKFTLKEVLIELKISQTTLYRLRKENGLLTQKVKRRYSEEEIEMLGDLLMEKYY
ncbi:MAG TPA: hypothetical protein DD434_04580 [Bacteroidales bacterium]|nr:hypothetical protein [Bacteroidales bacterium]